MWYWVVNDQATPLSTVKAQYDYDASAPGELSIVDGETLQVYERDEDWILVETASKGGKHRVGYVPANYVEDVSEDDSILRIDTEFLPCIDRRDRGGVQRSRRPFSVCNHHS